MQLEIIKFIKKYEDWEERLAVEPFCIKTKRDGDFVLLKYNQIKSDMTLNIVRECRGIILDEKNDFTPTCVPFFKFGNYGESYVPSIDRKTARIQEKLDGSLLKLWCYNNKWHISSNGEIDARNAHLHSALLKRSISVSLYDLFTEAWEKTGVEIEKLDKNYTYLFELTSPHNRVVVKHNDTEIHHIGTRDIRTLLECDMDIGISKPAEHKFDTLESCIESAKLLGYDREGYVVVDKSFNRVKVKSPLYVNLSHISQGVTTHSNIVEIIQKNEQDEFLTYFPEFNEVFSGVLGSITKFAKKQTEIFEEIRAQTFTARKDLAAVVTKTDCPGCIFALIDGKASTAHEWLMSRPAAKILEYIADS